MTFISRCLRASAQQARKDLVSSATPLDLTLLLQALAQAADPGRFRGYTLAARHFEEGATATPVFAAAGGALSAGGGWTERLVVVSRLAMKGKMEVVAAMVPDVGTVWVVHVV